MKNAIMSAPTHARLTYGRARELGSLGTVVFLPEDTARVFVAKIPEDAGFPLSEDFLRKVKAAGCGVLYQSNTFADGTPLTIQELCKRRENKDALGGNLLYSAGNPNCWYRTDPLFNEWIPRNRWRITARDVIPDTTGKNCVQQLLILAHFVEELFGDQLSEQGKEAIAELRDNVASIEKQCAGSDWQNGTKRWAALKFVELFLPYPVETVGQILMEQEVNLTRLFASIYGRTSQLSPGRGVVHVGNADAVGTRLDGSWEPVNRYGNLGCFFSCSAELWAD